MSPGAIGFVWVHSEAKRGRLVHSDARGFTRAGIGFAVFILVRVGSPWPSKGMPEEFGFAWIQSGAPSGRRIYSSPLVFSLSHLEVDGFIPVCLGPIVRAEVSPG